MVLRERTVAIAVIGVTGSGKSTFINLASRSNSPVSESSRAGELKSSTFSLDGQDIILIDTPGFGDTTPGILEVLKSISDHFSGLPGVKLAGVIYMHCMADDRMRGPSMHNFRVFSKFCDATSLQDILIVTNKRPEFANEDEFFGVAIDKGARMLYHDGSQVSTHVILRHLLHREVTASPAQEDSLVQKTDPTCTTICVDAACKLTSQVEHHTKALGALCQRIDASTLAAGEKTSKVLQEEAKDSLEKIERIRYDLEQMVTNIATENSRLEDENRRYRDDFTTQRVEVEFRVRLLEEERKARQRAEAQLVEERALWARQKVERDCLREHGRPKYDKLFACGALIFVALCVSRYAFDGPSLLL